MRAARSIPVCDKCRLQTCRLAPGLAELEPLLAKLAHPIGIGIGFLYIVYIRIGNLIYNLPGCSLHMSHTGIIQPSISCNLISDKKYDPTLFGNISCITLIYTVGGLPSLWSGGSVCMYV